MLNIYILKAIRGYISVDINSEHLLSVQAPLLANAIEWWLEPSKRKISFAIE